MKEIPLGTSGARVSELCLGTMFFGSTIPPERAFRLLDLYAEAGGSFLDTANVYYAFLPGLHGGESETVIGRWMKERGNRSSIFLATKVGVGMPGVEGGLKAAAIREQCENSLKRLGTEVIDLYYAHSDDRETPIEETLEAFDGLVQAGKVRFVGASNFVPWRLERSFNAAVQRGLPRYVCIQQWYSYLRPRLGAGIGTRVYANEELRDYCRASGLALIAYGPLLGGIYDRSDKPWREQFKSADSTARMAVLKSVAAELGARPNQVVLAWMMRQDPRVVPIITASREEHLRENIASTSVVLSREQMTILDAASA
jgi:aryl-alcohol dehydrogenase-like predicted oxidoreductase